MVYTWFRYSKLWKPFEWLHIKSALPNILEQSDSFVNNVLLFGDTSLDGSSNTIILNATINYITSIKWFDDPIFTF